MRNIARFVVDTHSHLTTLYEHNPNDEMSQKLYDEDKWCGLNGYIKTFDNSDFAVDDMDRYGVDMAVLLPSMLGCTNQGQMSIMDKYPGRFAACCCDGDTLLKYYNNPDMKYKFQYSLDEVEAALKTGRFSGIGEFAPGLNAAMFGLCPPPTLEQRMDEWDAICALAVKYNVPVHYHDFNLKRDPSAHGKYDYTETIGKILSRNPKAKIIASHGYKDPLPSLHSGVADKNIIGEWKYFYQMAADCKNLYLESGGWCEKNYEVAFDSGMTAARIIWGHDYGNVPQYLVRKGHLPHLPERGVKDPYQHLNLDMFEQRNIDSVFGGLFGGMPPVPTYHSDFYGWGMRIVDRVGDWLTQDEINLIMGGNAARLFKLPVPRSRMFPEARPDIFGENWKEEWYPFIPDEQIVNPDPYRLPIDC